jgi:nucleotide-binding universal stress UspA family protein
MRNLFNRLALGIAFSPTAPALLAESLRMARLCQGNLTLIHAGRQTPESDKLLQELLGGADTHGVDLRVVWEPGAPADAVLKVCKQRDIDLLVAGALKKENLVQHYLGSVARKIMRKANCSVLMLVNPSATPHEYSNVVVNAEDSPFIEEAILAGCQLAGGSKAWVHVVRELKMYGLTMAASDQYTEEEYDAMRHSLVKEEIEKVERLLLKIPHQHQKINIKVISGKSGFEVAKFAERKQADLLVVGAPPRKFSFFDRVFPHDLEYIFSDLPCNLLVVQPTKLTSNP